MAVRKRVGDVVPSAIPTTAHYQAAEVTAADHAATEGTICKI